ncbi:saframycin Mx1 synthetase B [Legionella beliardensis]|uniref:Saframycin Mx1 synthetase B n=1 Tax=Legionella beliardensis TaxID=91822 RepID=A0A378I272_9GAMM|nr:AMP-binding protein [Legionella beliardensis]STX28746.1 saframycin Mx1 synthetase B [Legionella beliardensis]
MFNKYPKIEYQHLCDILAYRNTHNPESIAYRFLGPDEQEELLTSGELFIEVAKLANLLLEYAKPGDRVILAAQPGLEYIIGFFACLRAGMIAVPVFPPANPQMASRLLHIIADAKPSLILGDKPVVSSLKKGQLATRFLPNRLGKLMGLSGELASLFDVFKQQQLPVIATSQRKHYTTTLPPVTIGAGTIAFLQYTSGSTDNPKGVVLTHKNLLANFAIMKQATRQTPESHIYSWLPPYHDMGLIGSILEPLYANIMTTFMSPQDFIKDPVRWVKHISKYRCTITSGPNFAYELCARRVSEAVLATLDLSCLDVAVNGAEPVSAKTLALFYDTFKQAGLKQSALFPCYGLAEATLMVTAEADFSPKKVIQVSLQDLSAHRVVLEEKSATRVELVSSGKAHLDVAIVDPNTQTRCRSDEVGEIWVHGDSVAQGYYRNEQETHKIFKNRIKDSNDPKEYLKTGDLGFFHDNHLFVCGRVKDLIIINGQNYYPQDLEKVVAHANAHIKKGNVIAFAKPGQVTERLVIVAELKGPADEEVYQAIITDIQKALSAAFYLTAQCIYLMPKRSIPKTTSGKLQRRKCAELIADDKIKALFTYCATEESQPSDQQASATWLQALLNTPEALRQDKLIAELQQLLAQVLNLPNSQDIDPKMSLFELGIDSLTAATLNERLKERLLINLSLNELFKNHTLVNLSHYLLSKIPATVKLPAVNASILPLDSNQKYPCSFTQESILKHYSINKEVAKYNLYTSVLLDKQVSHDAIIEKIRAFITSHDSLAIKFVKDHDTYQLFYSKQLDDACIYSFKLANNLDARDKAFQEQVLTQFDLLGGLLFRFVIFEYDSGEHEILFVVNHIISDVYSLIVAQQELINSGGMKKQLAQAEFNIAERSLYSRDNSDVYQLKDYGLRRLASLKPIKLHTQSKTKNELFKTQTFKLCPTNTMHTLMNQFHTTGFSVCVALMSLLLNALSLNEKIQLLIPLSKRKSHNDSQGLFATNLLICPSIDWNIGFKHLCTATQDEMLAMQENYYPLEELLSDLVMTKGININLPVVIGYLGDFSDSFSQLANIGATSMGLELMIYYAIDHNNQWTMHINYVEGNFSSVLINEIGMCFRKMLTQAIDTPKLLTYELYSKFSNNKALHDYAESLHSSAITVKTNMEGDILSDALHLFFETYPSIHLTVNKGSKNDALFRLSSLDKRLVQVVIIDANSYAKSENLSDEEGLLKLIDQINHLFVDDNQFSPVIVGIMGSQVLDTNAFKNKHSIFLQALDSSQYELNLIELIKKITPQIVNKIS